jgi:hypothetical protein
MSRKDCWIAFGLVTYLFVVGATAALVVALNFPEEIDGKVQFAAALQPSLLFPSLELRSAEQGLVLLAFLAGVAGSFLHTAQSLSSYLGNGRFRASWTTWYVLRPWIGGILGFCLYFVFRAGLIAGASAVNPFGVVAIGVLGGWFSKTTTDKLQEVFETLFHTEADRERAHKLEAPQQPSIEEIQPSPVSVATGELTILGRHFGQGACAVIGGEAVPAEVESSTRIVVDLAALPRRPAGEMLVAVRNADGSRPLSNPVSVKFEA